MAPSSLPDLQSTDYYSILVISRNASEAEINKAYKRLALQYHPDKHQNEKEQAEINFKRISDAYSVLGDARKRKMYDSKGLQGSESSRHRHDSSRGYFFDESDDFHGSFFGDFTSQEDRHANRDPFVFMSSEYPRSFDVNIDVSRIFNGFGLGSKKDSFRDETSYPVYAIPVNSSVVIRGLVSAAEHNTKTGKVQAYDLTQGRYKVVLDDSMVEIMVRPRNLLQQCPIEILGIESRPELTGTIGHVVSYNANNAEYVVLLEPSQEKLCVHRGNCLLKQGTQILLEGLSNEKFNGEMAQIVSVSRNDCRYTVRCKSGEQIKVKLDKVVC